MSEAVKQLRPTTETVDVRPEQAAAMIAAQEAMQVAIEIRDATFKGALAGRVSSDQRVLTVTDDGTVTVSAGGRGADR